MPYLDKWTLLLNGNQGGAEQPDSALVGRRSSGRNRNSIGYITQAKGKDIADNPRRDVGYHSEHRRNAEEPKADAKWQVAGLVATLV